MDVTRLIHLFGNRNYALFSVGNTVSLIGSWIQRIALAWLLWELTKSPFWLGLVAAAGMVPVILVAPLAGTLADRFSQTRIIALCQLVAFLLIIGLYGVYSAGFLTIGTIVFFRVCISTVLSISQPTRMALIPQLIEPELLTAGISFGALSFNIARFIGPAVAAALIAWGDFGVAFLVNALSFLVLMVAVLMMRIPEHLEQRTVKSEGVRRDILAAVEHIRGHPGISFVFLLYALIIVAGRPITEILPAFADAVFERGVGGLAILTSAMAIGSIFGGLWSAVQQVFGLTRTAIVAGGLNVVAIAVFTWIPLFWPAVAVLTLSSMFTVIFGVASQTLVQASVRETMRGRVMSLWFVIMRAGPPFGALLMGALTSVLGLSLPFSIAALLCVVVCIAAWKKRSFLADSLEPPARVLAQESHV